FVFTKRPEWADYYFWAPEISYDKGKVYIYYAAHKKNGNLCIGVASANKPEGPYKDHGPLMCQPDGSIDAFPMRNKDGKLYLIWKEDANSINKPTPIWAMQMNESRTALTGEKKELFRNDSKWEGNLVEGVSIIAHGDYFYAIYAASGCCGIACTYAVGVARSKDLLGPWEKYQRNPVLVNNQTWVCPGHGTPIEKDGNYYFLHHAYNKKSIPFTGREGILSRFTFTKDNWIEFIKDTTAPINTNIKITDEFKSKKLSDQWQWSIFDSIIYKIGNEILYLKSKSDAGSYIGQKIYSSNYESSVSIIPNKTTAMAGLGIIGDDKNLAGIFYSNGTVSIIQYKEGIKKVIEEKSISTQSMNVSNLVYFKMQVKDSKNVFFYYSLENKKFYSLNQHPVNADFIPPWDRAVRVGLISTGSFDKIAAFKKFQMASK
ncbi:MAG: family 43 glycosylhydrolase, partial [Flavisolibacter sp.]